MKALWFVPSLIVAICAVLVIPPVALALWWLRPEVR